MWSCHKKQEYKTWRTYCAMKNGWRSISTINCIESYQDTGWQITRKPSISHTRGREKNDWTNNTNNSVIYVVWPDMTLSLDCHLLPTPHHTQSNISVYKYGYFANVKKALAIKILFCTVIFQFIPRQIWNPSQYIYIIQGGGKYIVAIRMTDQIQGAPFFFKTYQSLSLTSAVRQGPGSKYWRLRERKDNARSA